MDYTRTTTVTVTPTLAKTPWLYMLFFVFLTENVMFYVFSYIYFPTRLYLTVRYVIQYAR